MECFRGLFDVEVRFDRDWMFGRLSETGMTCPDGWTELPVWKSGKVLPLVIARNAS